MLIHHALEHSAQRFPEKKAVWYRDQWMNYGEIEDNANRLAQALIKNDVRRGDRVAILLENSFEYIISYYAILKSGAITVSLNTATTADALTYLLNDAGAKAVISNQNYADYLLPAINQAPYLRYAAIDQEDLSRYEEIGHCHQERLADIFKNYPPKKPDVAGVDIDLASIFYTSGSTGKPKGATLSHLNVVANTRSIIDYLHLGINDRIMVILPFYYIYGKSLLNTHFFVCGSVVINNNFTFPNLMLDDMQQTQVTGFAGVPSHFTILLHKSDLKKRRFPDLRYVTQAGGAMAAEIQRKVAKIFKPAKLYVMYGATEAAARLSFLNPADLTRKGGSVGKAIPNVELFVVNTEGERLPPGQTGEIVARGSNMMQGYWKDPLETEKAIRNGLYFTGDIGSMDEEGYLFIVGRKKDYIKLGGERISSREIEESILGIEPVRETAVIGVEDHLLGEVIKAYVVLREGITLSVKEFKLRLSKKLPTYKIPKFVEFINELPKNSVGKIDKEKLRAMNKISQVKMDLRTEEGKRGKGKGE